MEQTLRNIQDSAKRHINDEDQTEFLEDAFGKEASIAKAAREVKQAKCDHEEIDFDHDLMGKGVQKVTGGNCIDCEKYFDVDELMEMGKVKGYE